MPAIIRAAYLPPVRTSPDAPPPSTTLKFPADWYLLPQLKAGTTVRFELPAEEVAKFVKGKANDGWKGTFCYQVNGSEPVRVNFGVNGPDGWQRSHPVEVALPPNAEKLTFWLELNGSGGPSYYSNFGRNFSVDINGRNPSMPPAPYNPPANTQTSDRWGHVIGSRPIDPPTPVVVINPSPRSDRWGHLLANAQEADGKIEWK
ncbi:MAG: hypothetical protein ACYC8T_34065 [Myxococcaceae bacterium]